MGWIKSALAKLVSLFVEDGSLALAIVVWLAVLGLVLSRFEAFKGWEGAVLFAGLASILIENTWRRARRLTKVSGGAAPSRSPGAPHALGRHRRRGPP
jgi:hypothetical protein